MAVTLAWRANPSVQPVWCAICAIFPTRPKSFRPRSLGVPYAQGVEAGEVGSVVLSARQRLHMLDLGRRAGEEKESAASLRVVAPHFGGAILAGEGGRPRQGA